MTSGRLLVLSAFQRHNEMVPSTETTACRGSCRCLDLGFTTSRAVGYKSPSLQQLAVAVPAAKASYIKVDAHPSLWLFH